MAGRYFPIIFSITYTYICVLILNALCTCNEKYYLLFCLCSHIINISNRMKTTKIPKYIQINFQLFLLRITVYYRYVEKSFSFQLRNHFFPILFPGHVKFFTTNIIYVPNAENNVISSTCTQNYYFLCKHTHTHNICEEIHIL